MGSNKVCFEMPIGQTVYIGNEGTFVSKSLLDDFINVSKYHLIVFARNVRDFNNNVSDYVQNDKFDYNNLTRLAKAAALKGIDILSYVGQEVMDGVQFVNGRAVKIASSGVVGSLLIFNGVQHLRNGKYGWGTVKILTGLTLTTYSLFEATQLAKFGESNNLLCEKKIELLYKKHEKDLHEMREIVKQEYLSAREKLASTTLAADGQCDCNQVITNFENAIQAVYS